MPTPKKSRQETEELLILRALNLRMKLSDKDRRKYYALEKGYQGEVMFDVLTEGLKNNCIVLNGLLFKLKEKHFQIDTIIIFQKTIYLIDVKNFEGDFIYKSDPDRFCKNDTEIDDPILQLFRSESKLRQLLDEYRFNLMVESYVVHINPTFTLYNAPQNNHVTLPTQINRFIRKLENIPSNLNGGHERLADLLISLDQGDYPNAPKPAYSYEELKKGPYCSKCHSFSVSVGERKMVCNTCGCEERLESVVRRFVRELILLFPERQITTSEVYEWCGCAVPRKTIGRVLKQNYKVMSSGKWTYYV
ncbi:nuclease-related domain-containing protein [Neobacillus rhizophilus]|uniref:NERD domain-containing protein n=1 Tax=Neobacillus rhizophilus TaxID=2833579 RepID=A0A942U4J6_9BACI|nr:nuclease-related domain-containing protein [Neobacillus rhizophilus]MBS4212252.1 NERD domain-containing protein [Neobacillus rhizophilus]